MNFLSRIPGKVWLFFILLTAAILRFAALGHAEFGYDELSAIFRAENAKDFYAHITRGVIPDGHPAGMQTFIWLWIRVFGITLILLKICMALLGIFSVYFMYRAGKTLLNEGTGLFAALFLAILYLPLDWSLQLRPYSPGLFFTSLGLWQLCEIIFTPSTQNRHRWWLALSVSGSLYTHYFAGLTLLVAGLAGFILTHTPGKKSLLISYGIALLSFIPHIPVTKIQFSSKGLLWLGKPGISFFPDHLLEIFSHSFLFTLLIGLLVITGLISALKSNFLNKDFNYKLGFVFIVFFIPLITGYLYSVWRAPVLQHSVLLFSMTGFLLLVSMILSLSPPKIIPLHFLLIGCCGLTVLIGGRKYYSEANENPYTQSLKYANAYAEQYKKSGVLVWMDGANDVLEYYIQKNIKPGVSYNRIQFYSTNRALEILDNQITGWNHKQVKYLAIGLQSGSDPRIISYLYLVYGIPVDVKNFQMGQFLLFDVEAVRGKKYPERKTYPISKPISLPLDSFHPNPTDYLCIDYNGTGIKGELQCSLKNEDQQIDWRSMMVSKYGAFSKINGNHLILKLADIPGWYQQTKLNLSLLELKENNPDEIMDIPENINVTISVIPGNPYMYGIFPEY